MESHDRAAAGDERDGEPPHLAEAAKEFPAADSRPLKDQGSTIDAKGDDIREYTGEPVDTGDGIVVPQQMAVGEDNVVGDGEFHDDDEQADPGGGRG